MSDYSPALQLASLLPHHDEMSAAIESSGGDVDAPLIRAIRRFTADIIANPNDAELWFDLSRAFGLWRLVEWKYLFVAHRLDPDNVKYLQYLAWCFNRIGAHEQAIDLLDQAIVLADDAGRVELIECKKSLKNEYNPAFS